MKPSLKKWMKPKDGLAVTAKNIMSDLNKLMANRITSRQLANYDPCLAEFKELYSSTPGVMMIDEDHWDGSTFAVLVDSKLFKDDSIPVVFKDYDIFICPVYEQLEQFKETVMFVASAHPNNNEGVTFFKRQVERLQEVINKYEAIK